MDDFTKIKLINSLIDAVEYFYDLKQKGHERELHLKGFCEGLSFSLVEMKILTKDEAKRILKGLGKKRVFEELIKDDKSKDLDTPAFLRKNSNPDGGLL